MHSGRNGARTPQTPYLAWESPSSAQPQPSKLTGDRMDWTSGHVAACLIVSSTVTLIITADGDAAAPRGPVSSERGVQRTQHCVHPSKELNMNAHVSDAGRALDVPRLNEGGKPPSQKP